VDESGSGLEGRRDQGNSRRRGSESVQLGHQHPSDANAAHEPRNKRSVGALASTMGVVVRDTLYATFDVLRGRYDR
jgi:hypothetical protein